MANIEKAKNHEGKTIFPVTVADAVLMGDGKTLKGELSELGSKVNVFTIVGDGDNGVRQKYLGVTAGNTYVVRLKNYRWDTTSLTVSSDRSVLELNWIYPDNGYKSGIKVSLEDVDDMSGCYTINAPEDLPTDGYLSVFVRANKGVECGFIVEEVKPDYVFYPYKDKKLSYWSSGSDFGMNIAFSGFNVKGHYISMEFSMSKILEEVSQDGENIHIPNLHSLVFSHTEKKFYIKETLKRESDDIIIFSVANGMFVYITPSLAYYVNSLNDYSVKRNYGSYIRVSAGSVYVEKDGFTLYYKNTTTTIGFVDGENVQSYVYDLNEYASNAGYKHVYLVIDTSKFLFAGGRENILNCLCIVNNIEPYHIVIAYHSLSNNFTSLVGDFKSVFSEEEEYAKSFYIYGKGTDVYLKKRVKGLIAGCSYRVRIDNYENIGGEGSESNWMIGLRPFVNGEAQEANLVVYNKEDNRRGFYDFVATENDYVEFGIRATKDELFHVQITDIIDDYIVTFDNNTFPNIKIDGNDIVISSNGFVVSNRRTMEKVGYVGYVESDDSDNTFTIEGNANYTRTYHVVKISNLSTKRLAFSKAIRVISTNENPNIDSDELILTIHKGTEWVYCNEGLLTAMMNIIIRRQSYSFIYNNASGNSTNVIVDDSKVVVNPNGFGIVYEGNIYYIGAEDRNRVEDYIFEFTENNRFLVIDTTKLINKNKRHELSEVVVLRELTFKLTDIPIAYKYPYNNVGVKLLGQFNDLFRNTSATVDETFINNKILFEPEFYAYKRGRLNRENGSGYGWYERFRIIHVSDTHQYNKLYKEALEVANSKVHVTINTGDESGGTKSSDADYVKSELDSSMSVVNSYNKLPYMQVPGNHDVTGLTKKEFFDRVCATISRFTPNVVWGSSDTYRCYGFVDFADTSYEGNYRIVMLDPFDYDDGLFENTYVHMSAVFSQKQIDWLVNVLIDSASKGYKVITMMHYSFGDADYMNEEFAKPDAYFMQDAFMIPDIIDAMQNKRVLNKQYADQKGINNISISKDFSSVPDLEFVAHLFGHIHSKNHFQCKKSDGSKLYDILMLGEAALGTIGTGLNKAYREENTINAIAFSALEIDSVEKCVYRVAYGSYLNYDKSNSDRTEKIPYRF